uniref:Uncharacterized protein n=1 Tax=Triticum urartu TaxID=4572 RepID=A0A8R7QI98_TRIUA
LVVLPVVRGCDLLAVRFACRHLGRRRAVEESSSVFPLAAYKLWLFEDSSHCLVAQRTRRSHLTILAELVQLTRYLSHPVFFPIIFESTVYLTS